MIHVPLQMPGRKPVPILLAGTLISVSALIPSYALGSPPALEVVHGSPGSRVEVSYDGREVAHIVEDDAPEDFVAQAEGPPVIYGAAPDWVNTVRRQVGGLQIEDLNGDGALDLAVVCYNSASFPPYDDWHNLIYFNTGTELEASASWISADEVSTGDVQVGDINGDTFPDVFAANGGFPMDPSRIYFGSAAGPSTTAGWTAGDTSWTNYALIFDVDHDEDLDVFTANQGNSELDPHRPMYGYINTAGSLETNPSWQSAETSIQNFLAFGDLDGDGWEDLAVSKWVGFESGIYRSAMGVLDTVPTWTTGTTDSDRGVAWADMDDNDDPDLALGYDPTQVWTNVDGVLTQTWAATGTFFGQQDLRWADVDDDGDPDLAEIHFANGVVNLYLTEGGVLGTTPAWSYNSAGAGTALAFGDLNGDGRLDLAVGNAGDPSVLVFYNQLPVNDIFADGFESGNVDAWTTSVGGPGPGP